MSVLAAPSPMHVTLHSPRSAVHHPHHQQPSVLAPSPVAHGHQRHASLSRSPAPTPQHAHTSAAATASHHTTAADSSGQVEALASGAAAQLVSDLVRKVASYRRGLVQERKEKKLLELNLEEAQLQQAHLTSLMREQDVQLMTALELSAQLEHALHMNAIEPLQVQSVSEGALAAIFAKPNKKEMEAELTRLFRELSTIQQYYHELEKRSLSDRTAFESSILKLTRDLKAATEALENRTKEARKYKVKCQEVMTEMADLREEQTKRKAETDQTEADLREELRTTKAEVTTNLARIAELEAELQSAREANATLSQQTTALHQRLDTLELTVRRFTCTRVRPNGPNVTCDISVKKVPHTGELLLCVKDRRPSPNDALFTLQPIATEYEQEYQQDLATVRCAVVEEASEDADDDEEGLLPPTRFLGSVLTAPKAHESGSAHSAASSASTSTAVASPFAGVALGFRPRFVLCFTADAHRCLIFETDKREYRRDIASTLRTFVRVVADEHVDELAAFFGDQPTTDAANEHAQPNAVASTAAPHVKFAATTK